jgi:carbamoyltransferase
MNYIGISSGFHDAALTVVNKKGDIVFAGHSERYSGKKHDKHLNIGLVNDAFDYYQGESELHYYERPWLKYLRQLRAGQKPKLINLSAKEIIGTKYIHKLTDGRGGKVHTHGHHLCHAAAGFQTSNFVDATVVVIDAIGEFDTISIWDARYDNNAKAVYKKLWSKKYPNSIGLFYSAMTKRVGLLPMEEEYIMMGMSAYGKPSFYAQMHMDLLEDSVELDFRDNLHIGVTDTYLDYATDEDIASSSQLLMEHMLQTVLLKAHMLGKSKNLVYGGGVALNCLANRHLGERFDNIWIMPNPGDAGSSLGAAALGYGYRLNWTNCYLGHNIPGPYPVNDTLDHLLRDRIVGVASGRAEFGPRALGNRSLLADPRGDDIKDKVNEIKRRQKFRPFAPVILEELASQYFDLPSGWDNSRYMQSVSTCRRPDLFPAITHYDGTSRVQTVPKDGSGIRELLEKWYVLTGCPMLLNTSLNVRGEPMVNNRQDADRFELVYNVKVLS